MRLLLAVLVLLLAACAVTLWRWTRTPRGRITLPAAVLSRVAAWQEADSDEPVPRMREKRRASMRFVAGDPVPLFAVRDERIPGAAGDIPVRIYHPVPAAEPLPLILYFHGGGWVLGDLDSHDNVCRLLASKSASVVVAVDYRLAPEHPYPAAVEDAWFALQWAVENAAGIGADPERIAVAGDSAGGNLAAVLTLMARERGSPVLRGQALIYPGVDMVTSDRASLRDFADGYFLTQQRIEWFKDQYVPDRARRGEMGASPLHASDHRGLPPAVIVTAEFDPLRDEGEVYGQVLDASGVPVAVRRYPGVIHGFVSMDRWFPEAGAALDFVSAELSTRLKRS